MNNPNSQVTEQMVDVALEAYYDGNGTISASAWMRAAIEAALTARTEGRAKVWPNTCTCHPETCCCADYKVKVDGAFLIAGTKEACERVAAAFNAATPAAEEGFVVPGWLLRQVFGMAREGCRAPSAAYRWCERIDALFFTPDGREEYREWELELPDAMLARPQPAQGDGAKLEGVYAPRYVADGPEGMFGTDNLDFAEKLIQRGVDDPDEWTVTDLTETGIEAAKEAPPPAPADGEKK